ncbi:MAG: glutamate-1-semialdehyde 2,1-aminomutase, partial [Candidatus Omnitrophota bacterium]
MSKLKQTKSKKVFARSKNVLVGGVNSPVRAFDAIGGNPIIVKEAHGGVIKDEDDNVFIDLCQSWGASILGHANSKIVQAIQSQARIGTSYGTTTAKELEIAKTIQ